MLAIFQLAMNRIDWLSKSAVDQIFDERSALPWLPSALMLVLAVVALLTRVASRWYIFNAGRDVEYELRSALLEHLHSLGAAFYRKMSAGEIMSRSSGDLLQVRLLFGFGILNLVNVGFAFASALQVMLSISGRLTVVSFVTLPLIVLLGRGVSGQLYTRTKANQEALGALSEVLQVNLAGVRVVRSFALERRERRRFDAANQAYLDASLGLARLRGLMGPAIGGAASVGLLAFFWYGAKLLLDGTLTKGAFFAFWLAYGRMTWPMIAVGFSVAIVQRGRAGFARLAEIFSEVPEIVSGDLPPPAQPRGALSVRGLSFAYGVRKREVLSDVAFDLPAGRSLAIMGRTGSGKSTLAMLLARLLPTPKGAVFFDGVDLCDLPLGFVRESVGYAQQDAFLFSTTVTGNVGFSLTETESEASRALIREAAKDAQVYEEAMALPEQLDTVVGERGVQLSGGQKQRIALARAFARSPRILVLDDPLSAVDAKTEEAILATIARHAKQGTLVLVTHRVAAASMCDEVVVLDEGRVLERGTPTELLANGSLYAAFAEEQSAERALLDLDLDERESAS
ncbi:MAG: ABC transporter ATP-binding protein [Myxococcales bacterium]|nr:ABC transporter ATP-binding protein [Myxococcales bacterium]HQY61261.1 ABC transporter ATP-binding protein [Polyangiaceae bacterium]